MRHAALLLALLACASLAACLEVESGARIEADGGGTFEEVVTIHEAKLALALRILKERTSGTGEKEGLLLLDPFGLLDPKTRLAELQATRGISEVTRTEAKAPAGFRRYVLRGRYRSLEALYEAGFVDHLEAALWRSRDGKAWHFHARSLYDDEEVEPASRKTLLAFRNKLLQPYSKALEGYRVQRSLVFPAPVLEHDGVLDADKRTVRWVVDQGSLADPRSLRQSVTFAASADLKLAAFGRPPARVPTKPAKKRAAAKESDR